MQYGRKAPKNAPSIPLKAILTGTVPDHPAIADYLMPDGWQMLGNDKIGDCVAVTGANVIRLKSRWLCAEERYPNFDDVIRLYKTQNPEYPDQDDGMDIQTCLEYMLKVGWPTPDDKILAFARVDMTDLEEIRAAIAIFGYIWTGVYVRRINEIQFENGQPWDYSASSPRVGGHSVLSAGYDEGNPSSDIKFISWAKKTSFTDAFIEHDGEEGWIVVYKEHFGSRQFLQGINETALRAAYRTLTNRDLPVVTPTPPLPSGCVAQAAKAMSAFSKKLAGSSSDMVKLRKAAKAFVDECNK